MLPVRGATLPVQIRQPVSGISIHAPRAGSDPPPGARGSRWCNFNPCSPCGERPSKTPLTAPRWNFNPCSPCGERPTIFSQAALQFPEFQSMLPVRGATGAAPLQPGRADISIHAPRAGSDQHIGGLFVQDTDFNPCSPCGERPWVVWAVNSQQLISIHAPRAGSDPGCPA